MTVVAISKDRLNRPLHRVLRAFAVAALACASVALTPALAQQSLRFVAVGDQPYGPAAQAPYRALIATINRVAPAFSVHVGDIKSGSTVCSDAELATQLGHFSLYAAGVVYTPGDNEWTDCHRPNNGRYDPLERLATVRRMFYTPGRSLGQNPIAVENQSVAMPGFARYVENQRWRQGEVLFATLHIVGSNNNFEVRDPAAVSEHFDRDAANIAWIRDTFALAARSGARALVFAMQADPFELRNPFTDFPGYSGFTRSIGQTLVPLAAQGDLPVLLIHGDSHGFRFDQPFTQDRKPVRQLTRLIVPGEGDIRAVEVSVDVQARQPFAVRLIETDR